jgi:hypothetical protein
LVDVQILDEQWEAVYAAVMLSEAHHAQPLLDGTAVVDLDPM